MTIFYRQDTENITEENLKELFLSVEWESAQFPEKLLQAIKGSDEVIAAWDGDELIGLINALSDGALTVYFHYVLTHPSYQGKGIGKEMMDKMLDLYQGYQTKMLVAYPNVVEFYGKIGFKTEEGNTPMYMKGKN
ncbi:GNAT family N-acetyltransferase [Saliterribacillus persicus]|uniref:Acetyltransferase (GNAT) family protein n=1 Tax=Saliterribacillus persicus TaxID=930114 RepID=A0A368YC40_9BACI|nr:GNAT family N-acetyltransferase [Saliterribacillus persicus]RCW77249.1 acetyltransferase (GNAT) family protein [Saliterribacillus persicus]